MDLGSLVFNALITTSLIVCLIVLIISVRKSFGNNLGQQLRWITIVQVLFQAGYIIRLLYQIYLLLNIDDGILDRMDL